MDTQAIIDDYVNKVAARLPRKIRNDVGLELRTLLGEQLQAAARDAGRSPDGEMATQLLRRFGRPEEVAARYAPPGFQLIAPEYSPLVVRLATLCIAIQWGLTLSAVFAARMSFSDWLLRWGFSAFAWLGLLVAWFGIASWVQRRSPVDPDSGLRPWTHWIFWVPFPRQWRPGEPQATEWRAGLHAAPLGAVLTIFFIAPAWILSHLLPAGSNTAWALYDAHFQRWFLAPLIALMAVRLLLLAAAVRSEPWRARTETLRFVLWVAFVVVLSWTLFAERIFAFGVTDALFKSWLLIFLLVNVIQILVWLWRETTRVRVPTRLARPR